MALPEQPVERGLPTPSIAVVICTWTADRLDLLRAAVGESLAQLGRCDELVVVIDHNEVLRAQLAREWHGTRARVVGSEGPRGLSGARNTGVGATKADVLVFLDDDALPSAGWLGTLREAFEDATVAAVGGGVVPRWSAERPTWFPDEFGWVVGCDYTGLAPDGAEIRNPIGANMAVRRDVLPLGDPFRTELGRDSARPLGCEETELGIRIRRHRPEGRIIRVASARVHHNVPAERARLRYVLRRCWYEGVSKRQLTRAVGGGAGLSAERGYLLTVLPAAFLRHLCAPLRREPGGVARALVLTLGTLATALGYAAGRR